MTEENKIILDTDKLPNFADTFIDINTYRRLEQERDFWQNKSCELEEFVDKLVKEKDELEQENKRFREENKLLRDSKFKELDRAFEAEDKYKSALEEVREILNLGICKNGVNGNCRPIRNTKKEDCYNAIYKVKDLIREVLQ